jgi:uncharacterized membrane protein YgdD (TMEM256/DUF423 family)
MTTGSGLDGAGYMLLFHAAALLGGAAPSSTGCCGGSSSSRLPVAPGALFSGDLALRAFAGHRLFQWQLTGGIILIAAGCPGGGGGCSLIGAEKRMEPCGSV